MPITSLLSVATKYSQVLANVPWELNSPPVKPTPLHYIAVTLCSPRNGFFSFVSSSVKNIIGLLPVKRHRDQDIAPSIKENI